MALRTEQLFASAAAGLRADRRQTRPYFVQRTPLAPVRAISGSFACQDGSEPECEDGSTPTRSSNGRSLVCPIVSKGDRDTSEAECAEDAGPACNVGPDSSSTEQSCQASSSDSSSVACEDPS